MEDECRLGLSYPEGRAIGRSSEWPIDGRDWREQCRGAGICRRMGYRCLLYKCLVRFSGEVQMLGGVQMSGGAPM